MNRSMTSFFVLAMAMSTSPAIAQAVDVVAEVKTCAQLSDPTLRYACFDELGNRVLEAESATEAAVPEAVTPPDEVVPASAPTVQPLPEDAGLPVFTGDREAKSDEYSATVTSCEQGLYGTWYFTFDNGQVWKEVNSRDRRFTDCSFEATIKKDFFGYKMQIEGDGKPIRVTRHK